MMKLFLRTLIALLYLTSVIFAQAGMLINSYAFGSSSLITFVSNANDISDLTTYTFTGQSIGTATSDRYLIIGVGGADGATDFSISTVTVDAVSTTLLVDNTVEIGSQLQTGLYIISQPTGTTANIVVTFSEPVVDCVIAVWRATNINPTPVATAQQFQTASANIDLSINVNPNSVAAGFSGAFNLGASTTTWAGLTERIDVSPASANIHYSAADITSVAGGTPLTIGSDWTGTADAIGVSASFSP